MNAESLSPVAFRGILTRSIVAPITLLGILALIFLAQILYLLSAAKSVEHTDRVISQANSLLTLLVDGETGQRGYLLTDETSFLEPYYAEENHVDSAFDELLDMVVDNPAQVARLKTLREDQTAWRDYSRKVLGLRRAGKDPKILVTTGEGKRRMDGLREQVAAFITAEESLRETRSQRVQLGTWIVATTSLGIAMLLGSALALFTRRKLLQVSRSYQNALTTVEQRADSLRKSAHRLETLHVVDRAILADVSIAELVQSALHWLSPSVPSAEAIVFEFDPDQEHVQIFPRAASIANDKLALAGFTPSDFCATPASKRVDDLQAVDRNPVQDHLFRLGYRSWLEASLQADEECFGTLVLANPLPCSFTDEHVEIIDEIARQLAIGFQHSRLREQVRQNAAELERKVDERTHALQESLSKVRQLQGMLPICAWCKKIRDDQNYWHQVEHYVAAHSDARFSHGICPACLKKLVDSRNATEHKSNSDQ